MTSDNDLLLVVAVVSIVIAVGLIGVSFAVLLGDGLQRRRKSNPRDRR